MLALQLDGIRTRAQHEIHLPRQGALQVSMWHVGSEGEAKSAHLPRVEALQRAVKGHASEGECRLAHFLPRGAQITVKPAPRGSKNLQNHCFHATKYMKQDKTCPSWHAGKHRSLAIPGSAATRSRCGELAERLSSRLALPGRYISNMALLDHADGQVV